MSEPVKYLVLRDSREQQGWDFRPSSRCLGTTIQGLKTGDYSIQGWESVFVVERKASTGEWVQNINQARFTRELERLTAFPHAYIVLEFSLDDIASFPVNSGIPERIWPKLKIRPDFILKRTLEMMLAYPSIHFIFAGSSERAKEFVSCLFKRIVENVECPR